MPNGENFCTIMSMEHTTWIEKVTQGDSAREIGRKTGVPFRTITTQINRNKISAENVILIAIAYDTHPVRALVDCDYLEAQYAATTDPSTAIKEIDDEGLAEEVLFRLTRKTQEESIAAPLNGTVSSLEERRNSNTSPEDVPPLRYVADDTDTEPGMGDEGYHDGP